MPRIREFSYYLMVVVVVGVCSLTAFAQLPLERQPGPGQSQPRIVSGDDLGFRVDGTDPRTGNPTGALVIRVNGKWVEVGAMPGIRPAK